MELDRLIRTSGAVVASGENYERFKAMLHSFYYGADTAFSSQIGTLAQEGWDYYYGKLPQAAVTGGSKYVDRSVFNAVEGTVQDLLNVFTGGEEYCSIRNDLGIDIGATQYINKVITRENDGYRELSSVFREACVTRNSYIKFWWEDSIELVEEEFGFDIGMSADELEQYLKSKKRDLNDESPRVLESVEDEFGLISGVLEFSVDRSGIRFEYVPFEEVIFDANSKSIKDADYLCHRTDKTREELNDMGFTDEMLALAGAGTEDLYTSEYKHARNAGRIPSMTSHTHTDDSQLAFTLCEHYVRTSLLNPRGKVLLYQVFTTGNGHVLEINEVDMIPIATATPSPIPGSIYGQSVVDITKDIQDIKSAIYRGYIDNIHNANHGGMMALKGAYNKRDLMDNRPRRIVEIDVANAVTPFPYNPLPQGIDGLIEHMELEKEMRSGVTRLSQGLNGDVFSNDNAFATVSAAMSAAQNRLKMIARSIAENFMKDFVLGIYTLARKNDKRVFPVSTFMGTSPVIPYKQWPEKININTEVAIGAGERQAYAQKLMQAGQMLASSPVLAGSAFTQQNAHFLAHEAMKYMGIRDLPMALTPMSQVQPKQPDPMAVKEKELELGKLQAEIAQLQAAAGDKQSSAQEKQANAQVNMQRLAFEQQKAADEFKLSVQDYTSKGQREADRTAKENFEVQIKLMEQKLAAALKSSDAIAKQEMEADKLTLEQRKMELEVQLKAKELQIREMELRVKAAELQMKGEIEATKIQEQREQSDKQLQFSREQTQVQGDLQRMQMASQERSQDKVLSAKAEEKASQKASTGVLGGVSTKNEEVKSESKEEK